MSWLAIWFLEEFAVWIKPLDNKFIWSMPLGWVMMAAINKERASIISFEIELTKLAILREPEFLGIWNGWIEAQAFVNHHLEVFQFYKFNVLVSHI